MFCKEELCEAISSANKFFIRQTLCINLYVLTGRLLLIGMIDFAFTYITSRNRDRKTSQIEKNKNG